MSTFDPNRRSVVLTLIPGGRQTVTPADAEHRIDRTYAELVDVAARGLDRLADIDHTAAVDLRRALANILPALRAAAGEASA